jgi:exodeoxyribonuclease-3
MPPKTLKICSFNVSSIRARVTLILDWLSHRGNDLDILCFQELKATLEDFPLTAFEERGYSCAIWGQKGYNGVATSSKVPPLAVQRGFAGKTEGDDSRIITTFFPEFTLINIYAPHGGEPGSKKWWNYSLGRKFPAGINLYRHFFNSALSSRSRSRSRIASRF